MYIVKPELDDQQVQQEIEKVGQLIQTNGGQVKKVPPWGKRRLAYTVKDQREGHYVVEEFDLDQAKVQEADRALKISDTHFRNFLFGAAGRGQVMNPTKATLIGRLPRDPERRYTPSGAPVTTFSLATNRYGQ